MDALLERARVEWLDRALADRPTDRQAVGQAVGRLYELCGLPLPAIMWTATPVAGATESQRFTDAARNDPEARRILGPPRLNAVLGAVQSRLRGQIELQLDPDRVHRLDAEVGAWLTARLGPLRSWLIGAVVQELGGWRRRRVAPGQLSFDPQAWDQPALCGYGYLDAPWLAVADAARSLGARYRPELGEALDQLGVLTGAGWWWPYQSVVVVSERPSRIRLDEQFRLHCEEGPALVQGTAEVFAWHGLAVDGEGLEPGIPLSVRRVLRERDPDLQRLLVNRYGVERFRRDARATLVDRDRYGTLWRIRLPDGDALQMVEVVNSTPEPDGSRRRYSIRVPPNLRTPIAAVAWTFGLTASEYRRRLRVET